MYSRNEIKKKTETALQLVRYIMEKKKNRVQSEHWLNEELLLLLLLKKKTKIKKTSEHFVFGMILIGARADDTRATESIVFTYVRGGQSTLSPVTSAVTVPRAWISKGEGEAGLTVNWPKRYRGIAIDR